MSVRPRDLRRPRRASGRRGPREAALQVLERVRTTDAYANRVLPSVLRASRLSRRDVALATELAYGTLRMRGTLDWVISLYSTRPPERIDPAVLDALRVGVYQLLYTSIPPHAAVAETVGCVANRGAAGFVNAVLRELVRRRPDIPWPRREGDLVAYLHITHSHPAWIVRMWAEELGIADAEALCEANNVFPGVSLRANAARASRERVADGLRGVGLSVEEGRWAPDALRVVAGGDPVSWPGFAEGMFAVQDEASVLVGAAMDVRPDWSVVDLCAGPGGKTSHLAQGAGHLIALEIRPDRARMVRDTARRLGVSGIDVVVADGRRPPLRPGVDAVLVDAPCTGLGVVRRRPEARWRVRPEDVERSAALQEELLRAGFTLLRPGGTLVYSVCTVTRAETIGVVEGFCESEPGAEPVDVLPEIPRPHRKRSPFLQLLPHVHGTDGMFIAKLRRRDG